MKKILFLLLFMIILSNPTFATASVSITDVIIPSSVTTGDSFTITMSVSGSEVTNMQCSLTTPSQISCTGGTQTCDSGSASWSCSATVAGDYSNQITASVTATYGATTLTDNQQTGLQVLSPASLTTSSTISASSVAVSGTVTLTVGVNNAGGTVTTYSISLSCPTGLTCSPSSVATNSIDGSTLENNAFTITGGTAGSYTLTATVVGGNGQTLTTSQSLTVTTTTTTPSTGGGSGTAGGAAGTKVTVKRGNANITVPSIAAGKMANVTITKTEDVAVRQINISVTNSVNNIKIVITKLAGLPASVTHEISGKVYHYIQIDKTNFTDTDVNKVFIKFAVNKTWLTDNDIAPSNISLYRWENDRWNELATTYLSEDAVEAFYQAESSGFSYFLIGTKSGEVTAAAPTGAAITCTESWSCTGWSVCAINQQTRSCTDANACGTTIDKPVESQSCEVKKEEVTAESAWIYYSVSAVILIAIAAIMFIFRKKITPTFSKLTLKFSKKKQFK
jgi:PGF-pre-PGF domain-containing protein